MRSTRTLAAATIVAVAGIAFGQNGPSPERPGRPPDRPMREGGPPRERGPRLDDREMNPQMLRARLSRELERVRTHEARLTAALDALDAGEDPREVLRGAVPPGADGPFGDQPDGAGPAITPEERERALVMLGEFAPEMAERLRLAADENPVIADRILTRIVERQREIADLEQWNPELAEIKRAQARNAFELRAAADQYRDAVKQQETDPEAFAAADEELRALLGRQFDLDTSAKQNEIDQLTRRIGELQAQLDERESERATLIDEQMERMLKPRGERFRRGHDRD